MDRRPAKEGVLDNPWLMHSYTQKITGQPITKDRSMPGEKIDAFAIHNAKTEVLKRLGS